VWSRQCLFSKIENNEMILNDVGDIASLYWFANSEHIQPAVLNEHVIMPSHVHGIIELSQINRRFRFHNNKPI
jgi:putative transposase